jgi:7-keto-8-aminopelargonate synthetase-like enzyme
MKQASFNILEGSHPIVPVMFGDAKLAKTMASDLLKEGIYVFVIRRKAKNSRQIDYQLRENGNTAPANE